MPAIRRQQRHAGGHRAQHFVGVLGRRAPGGRGGLDGCGRRLRLHAAAVDAAQVDAVCGEDRLVEVLPAVEQLFDAAEILARLRALDDAVVVGARERHRLLDAERPQRGLVGVREARREADRAGGNDRALARHQPRNRRDGADAAGIGQRDRRAAEFVRSELVVAGARDEILVRRAERGEVERVGVAQDGDD